MAASSQVSQNKRGRDECWNGGLLSPGAKRTNSGFTLAHDSDLMAFVDKIDYLDKHNCNREDTDAVNEVEGKIREFDQKGGSDQMGSIKEVELIDRNSEVISSMCDTGDFTYYDNVGAELGFFDDITPHELGIIMNHCPCYVDGDWMHDIVYSHDVYGYASETSEAFWSLWEDDIWQLNEHPVIQNEFASPQQKEDGINGTEFHDICKDIRPIQG